MTSGNIDKLNSNGKKLTTVMGLAIVSAMWMWKESLPISNPVDPAIQSTIISENESIADNKEKRKMDSFVSISLSPSRKSTLDLLETNQKIAAKELPIFLAQSSTKEIHLSNWGTVASRWDRTAQYEDLIQDAEPIQSLPHIDKSKKRPKIIIHCGPKSGSTTLRRACKFNLKHSCGLEPDGSLPYGYMNTKKFYPMVRSCTETHHFCAKNITMPMDVPAFDDMHFIHMFPFRNYDEWAKSALKQQFDRSGENGCQKTANLFFERNCKNSSMEIDFRKYGKTDLAMYKDYVVERMNEKNESHLFLLYHHRELNEILAFLSEVYQIPKLPGSDGHGKDVRPVGTCNDTLLEKFHECFSWQLTELT